MGRRKTEQEKDERRKSHRLVGKVYQSGGAILRSRNGAVIRTVEDEEVSVPGANSVAKSHVQFDGIGVDFAEAPSFAVKYRSLPIPDDLD